MEIGATLAQTGFSQQEAHIYLTTLKIGQAKASEIAQKAGVHRSGAYYTLKLLQERGVVSEVIKSGVHHYSAAPPERLLEIIDDEARARKAAITSIVPELRGLQRTALTRPEIEVFEGDEGFKTIFTKLLETGEKELRCYLSPGALRFHPEFHVQFRRRRVERGISIRTLTRRTPELLAIQRLDRKELRETRFIDDVFGESGIMFYILSDAIISIRANAQEQVAIFTRDESVAAFHRRLFEREWLRADDKR